MQAAQIDPKKLYAVHVHDEGNKETYVARFKVDYVKSFMSRRQLKPTLADYSHQIYGRIDERDVPPQRLPADLDARSAYLTRILEPHQIEDEYERFIELKQRAIAEKKAADDERNRRIATARELVSLLYKLTDLKPEEKKFGQYVSRSPFVSNDYDGGMGISFEGVEALLPALLQLTANQETADK
jgi:hypothetical protein